MADVAHLTQDTFKSTLAEAGDTPVLVDFYAEWCGPCKMMAPVLDDLAKKFEGKVIIHKVNVDEESELAGQFEVRSIPTMMVFHQGQPFGQPVMGFRPAPQMSQMLDEVIAATTNAAESK
jgi:thioredoxin 1